MLDVGLCEPLTICHLHPPTVQHFMDIAPYMLKEKNIPVCSWIVLGYVWNSCALGQLLMATIFQCLISMFDLFQYCIVCTYIFSHVDLDPHLTHQKTRLSPGLGTFTQFSGLTEGCWGFCRHMSITTVFQGEALPCNLLGMNSVPCRITDWLNGSKLGKAGISWILNDLNMYKYWKYSCKFLG